jgi:orotate phosphoribosyltransferase
MPPTPSLDDLRRDLLATVLELGYRRLDEPVELASGQLNQDFVDGKAALRSGADLAAACRAMVALAEARGIDFDSAGGLTMGADQFAHGIAVVAGRRWFVVRKEPKARGTRRLVEGDPIGPGTRVLLVEDVISTGGSLVKALDAVAATGAEVVFATTLVDRGDLVAPKLAERCIPYEAVLTYRDLAIEPITGEGTR